MRAARSIGLKICMVHENDPERGGCPFANFFSTTPGDLIGDGLYRDLAIAFFPQPHREVSVATLSKMFGAVPGARKKRGMMKSMSKSMRSFSHRTRSHEAQQHDAAEKSVRAVDSDAQETIVKVVDSDVQQTDRSNGQKESLDGQKDKVDMAGGTPRRERPPSNRASERLVLASTETKKASVPETVSEVMVGHPLAKAEAEDEEAVHAAARASAAAATASEAVDDALARFADVKNGLTVAASMEVAVRAEPAVEPVAAAEQEAAEDTEVITGSTPTEARSSDIMDPQRISRGHASRADLSSLLSSLSAAGLSEEQLAALACDPELGEGTAASGRRVPDATLMGNEFGSDAAAAAPSSAAMQRPSVAEELENRRRAAATKAAEAAAADLRSPRRCSPRKKDSTNSVKV